VTRSRRIWAFLFLVVPVSFYLVVVIYPLLSSFYYSFTDWNGFGTDYNMVGTDNFERIKTDRLFRNAIENTVIWTAAAIVLPTTGGLVLALALHERGLLSRLYKSLFYLPICLSLVVVGQVWIWIYQPDWGLINTVFEHVGLSEYTRAWMADPDTALESVIAAWTWQQTGLAMVIFLAGLTAVPRELTEAAQIDGANYLQNVRNVIIPLLRPATIVVIALAVINSLKSFDILYMMTKGGPFHSSDNLAYMVYNEAFQKYRMGYSSAIAVVLFLITLIVISVYFRQERGLEQMYD
jgi:ABC-type sugar transport system permease subunit